MAHYGRTRMAERFQGFDAVGGIAHGRLLRLDDPLSLWGGLDIDTGEIIDRLHPQVGHCVAATVLMLPAGRGSSSASSVLAETVRVGTAPRAIVLSEPDEILLLGALVAEELYGSTTPVVVCRALFATSAATGDELTIDGDEVAWFPQASTSTMIEEPRRTSATE